jgi:uncharacterized Ntn-hydrolase superfamily protein
VQHDRRRRQARQLQFGTDIDKSGRRDAFGQRCDGEAGERSGDHRTDAGADLMDKVTRADVVTDRGEHFLGVKR